MDVGRSLRKARTTAGLSQTQLAARSQVTRVSISRYESGVVMPAADTYFRLLAACRDRQYRPPTLDEHDRTLVDAQLARTPEGRLHASHEFSRLRAQMLPRG